MLFLPLNMSKSLFWDDWNLIDKGDTWYDLISLELLHLIEFT
jgi:hypothetical protein